MVLTSGEWPTAPDEIVLDDGAAENGDYELGDEVGLLAPFGESERTATLVGTAEFNGGGTAGATLLVFSTEGAQELFLDGADAFHQVSPHRGRRRLAGGARRGRRRRSRPRASRRSTGDQVAEESQDAIGQFLDVISTFLLVFAIIAVIVGGFIIVNTFTILVAQRSRELALLRALGAGRRQVTSLGAAGGAGDVRAGGDRRHRAGLAARARPGRAVPRVRARHRRQRADARRPGGARQLRRRHRRDPGRGVPARAARRQGRPGRRDARRRGAGAGVARPPHRHRRRCCWPSARSSRSSASPAPRARTHSGSASPR